MQNINPFDDMIPDMLCNKKIHPMVIEVLYRVQSQKKQKKQTITQKLLRLKNKIPDCNHSKYTNILLLLPAKGKNFNNKFKKII